MLPFLFRGLGIRVPGPLGLAGLAENFSSVLGPWHFFGVRFLIAAQPRARCAFVCGMGGFQFRIENETSALNSPTRNGHAASVIGSHHGEFKSFTVGGRGNRRVVCTIKHIHVRNALHWIVATNELE